MQVKLWFAHKFCARLGVGDLCIGAYAFDTICFLSTYIQPGILQSFQRIFLVRHRVMSCVEDVTYLGYSGEQERASDR